MLHQAREHVEHVAVERARRRSCSRTARTRRTAGCSFFPGIAAQHAADEPRGSSPSGSFRHELRRRRPRRRIRGAFRISPATLLRNSISLPAAIDCMSIRTGMKAVAEAPVERSETGSTSSPLRRSPQNTSSPPRIWCSKRLRTSANSASRPKNIAAVADRIPTMNGFEADQGWKPSRAVGICRILPCRCAVTARWPPAPRSGSRRGRYDSRPAGGLATRNGPRSRPTCPSTHPASDRARRPR